MKEPLLWKQESWLGANGAGGSFVTRSNVYHTKGLCQVWGLASVISWLVGLGWKQWIT